MSFSRFVALAFPVAMLGLGADVACAQDYPTKTIRIVTGGAGGGSDLQSRIIAQKISVPLGHPVIVDNRSSTFVAADALAKAAPDGYTLYINGGGTWIMPLLQPAPYDVVRDFAPISLISRDVNIIAVHPSVPAKTIKELIALAKTKPGTLNYGSGSPGSTGRLGTELFKSMAGINMTWIPYKGSSQAVNALIAGQVQVLTLDAGLLMPLAKAGKLTPLAITSTQPSAMAPDIPTVAASGLPGFESVGMTGMFAPAKTPAAIINRLNQETVRYLRSADAKETFSKLGTEVADSTPEQLGILVRNDVATMGKLIKEVGITVD